MLDSRSFTERLGEIMRDRQIGKGGRVIIALLGVTIGLATANAQDAGLALAPAMA